MDALPYRCESCTGTGYVPAIVIGLRVVRPECQCTLCVGRGRVSQLIALRQMIASSASAIALASPACTPRYLRQAQLLGDARLLGFWARLCAWADSVQRMRNAMEAA